MRRLIPIAIVSGLIAWAAKVSIEETIIANCGEISMRIAQACAELYLDALWDSTPFGSNFCLICLQKQIIMNPLILAVIAVAGIALVWWFKKPKQPSFTTRSICENCKSANGVPKVSYLSKESVEEQADFLKMKIGLIMEPYKCQKLGSDNFHLRTILFRLEEEAKDEARKIFDDFGHILDVKPRKKKWGETYYLTSHEYDTEREAQQQAQSIRVKTGHIMHPQKQRKTNRYRLVAALSRQH